LWATRAGIDVTSLPARVPATAGKPEMVLLFTGGARLLSALDLRDGSLLWKYPLPSASVGRPVILDGHAYLPTVAGLILEIDLTDGRLVGRYDVGQRLSAGGARFEGTKLLYFPADELCVYVLDAANHQCA